METGFLLFVAAAALLFERRDRAGRRAGLAAVAAGLALAALRAAPTTAGLPGRAGGAALPAGFVATDAALVAVAVLGAGAAAVEMLRAPRSVPATIAAGLLLAGVGAVGWGGRDLVAAADPRAVLVACLVLIVAGALLLAAGRFLRIRFIRAHPTHWPVAAVAGLIVGALAAAVGPHVGIVFTGVIVAGWSGYLLQRLAGRSKAPVAPTLTLLLLPAWWLMATIAGPESLRTAALPMLPLSPAAERALAPALLLAGWALSGLWPLHRQQPGPLSAIVGALLVARVAMPAVPDGMDHWRPLAMPLVVAGLWHGALGGRLSAMLIGLAWTGLLAAAPEGCIGAGLLLAGALAVELPGLALGAPLRRAAVRIAAGSLAGWGALLVVTAQLQHEVVYTVLAVGGIVAALGRPQAMTASARSTTAPSA